jgi:hypothetical protein
MKLQYVNKVGISALIIIVFLLSVVIVFCKKDMLEYDNRKHFRDVAFIYIDNMKDYKTNDIDRFMNIIYEPAPYNFFKWKKEDFIKDHELYQIALDMYRLDQMEKEMEKSENDKTFPARMNHLKETREDTEEFKIEIYIESSDQEEKVLK